MYTWQPCKENTLCRNTETTHFLSNVRTTQRIIFLLIHESFRTVVFHRTKISNFMPRSNAYFPIERRAFPLPWLKAGTYVSHTLQNPGTIGSTTTHAWERIEKDKEGLVCVCARSTFPLNVDRYNVRPSALNVMNAILMRQESMPFQPESHSVFCWQICFKGTW